MERIIQNQFSEYDMEEATCNITESIRYEDGEVVLERGNDVETYVVPEGVTIISDEAFLQFANIKKIFIPKSVTEIENCAFAEISLQEIVVDKENTHYKSIDGVLYDYALTELIQCPCGQERITIPDTVTEICDFAFDCCTKLSDIVIPDSVTKIGNEAFFSCVKLSNIIIPDSVTEIGDMALDGCKRLKSLTLSKSLTCMPNLGNLRHLKSVTIPASVIKIGNDDFEFDDVFGGCVDLQEIVVCNDNTHYRSIDGVLYDYAVSMLIRCPCQKKSVVVPDTVVNIHSYAFAGCTHLTTVVIPPSVRSLENYSFCGCTSLRKVVISEFVENLGSLASQFSGCISLQEIEVMEGNPYYKSIDGVLYNSKVSTLLLCPSQKKKINIPDTVKSIESAAFFGCEQIMSIVVPPYVTHIGDKVFSGCANLRKVALSKSIKKIGDEVFQDCEKLQKIYVDQENTYFKSIDGVLYDYSVSVLIKCPRQKKSVVIPDTVTSIKAGAFMYCSQITSIVVPPNVTYIGRFAFMFCTNLERIVLSPKLERISRGILQHCPKLTEVIVPDSVISIEDIAFQSCTQLKRINIPSSVRLIGHWAFNRCVNLSDVILPPSGFSAVKLAVTAFQLCPFQPNQEDYSYFYHEFN